MSEDDPDDPGAVADELYALDPNDFVAGRTDLVRRLRAEKRRAVAAEVAKLRRPTPAAWAVNQLARSRTAEVEALLRLGEELRRAQERALGGADAGVLRDAARKRRDAVAALTGVAAGLLAARGAGVDAHLPGVTATLEAASVDPGLGAAVLAGRLAAEADPPSGFGGLDVELPDLRPAPAPAAEPEAAEAGAEPEPGPEADGDADVEARRADEVRRAERALAKAVERSDDAAAAARQAAARTSRRASALDDARAEVGRLRARLEDAERDLVTAEEQLEDARRRATEADEAADAATRAVEEAQAALSAARQA